MYWVCAVKHQKFCLAAANFLGDAGPVIQAARLAGGGDIGPWTGWIEPNPSLLASSAHQVVEGVDGLKIEKAVALRAGGPAADGDAGLVGREPAGQVLQESNRVAAGHRRS